MPRNIHRAVEVTAIGLITLGIVGMFQAVNIDLYTWGFHILLIGTLTFIIISHIPAHETNDSADK